MKKKTLLALSLCAILVAALRVGGRQATGDTAATGTAFFMPGVRPERHTAGARPPGRVAGGSDPSLDFSDLDARDSQNRPILRAESTQALATLFRENLLDLTVFAGPHAATQTMSQIESILHLLNKSILMNAPTVFGLLIEAIMPPSRRFVHNVHNLWITFSVGLFGGCLLLSALRLPRSPLRIHLRL
jgi:hypothetical protein